MVSSGLFQFTIAVLISSAVSVRAYIKKSLDLGGAISGFLIMTIHIAINYRYGAILLAFFFTSSLLTKYGEDTKKKVDAHFKEGGQRTWKQVVFNSGIATILILMVWKLVGTEDHCLNSKESRFLTWLTGGIIGHYCCSNGDTWSSELGILSNEQPRLITTLKPVRRGTNGGITGTGLAAAAGGGIVIGVTFVVLGFVTAECDRLVTGMKQLLVIPISGLAGLVGSIIDSLLGATLQYSGFCSVRNKVVDRGGPTVKRISGMSLLDNNGVNLVSILLTSLLTSAACLYVF
ncbi:hypothetical protein M569_07781 [Genlisea aurea]|uniref:Integral membrane family protein n=1 Tax=Genlisea aurea TaxID=192259 RepID=S8CJ12_9LAMI|nr:hypothetical protein M569_07781 [Genlisea aurea]